MSYQRSRRVEAKLAENRTQILQAARRLVSEGGWRETQMVAIAAAANLATGTIYRYFPSKAELFAEVLAIVSQREVDVIQGIVESGGPAKQRLADAVAVFALRALRGRQLAYALIAEPCEPEIDQARLVYRRAIGERFEQIIASGVAAGEFPPQDPRIAASCAVGAMMEALVGPLAPESSQIEKGSGDFVAQIVRFCLGAVSVADSLEPNLVLPAANELAKKPGSKGKREERK